MPARLPTNQLPAVVRPVVARRMAARPVAPVALNPLTAPAPQLAQRVFWVLTAINFLNYLDRIVFVAVGPDLKHAFRLDDGQVGFVASAFLLVYTLAALPMGLLADRGPRTRIIALGVAAWSLATWYTAVAHTFTELFIGRAVLGIGEASYIPAGIALLAAYFPPDARARIMSRWGASTLVGTAVGFIAGGVIAQHFGWRWAFVLCGPPGLILAWLAWRTPNRLAYDAADQGAAHLRHSATAPAQHGFLPAFAGMLGQARDALRSPTVRISILISALGLFVTTPAVVFIPIYLREHYHMTTQTTAFIAGGVLIPAGVGGTLLGGALADYLSKRFAGGRLLAVAIGFGCASPFFIVGFLAENLGVLLGLAFIATMFMNMYNGPLNAALQDVVPPALRASAFAVVMTLAHLMGDVSSPTIVGELAGRMARHNVAHALVACGGPALVLGAVLALVAARVYAAELQVRGQTVTEGQARLVTPVAH